MAAEPRYSHNLPFPIDKLTAKESVVEKFSDLAMNPVFVQYGHGENDAYLRYVAYLGMGSGLHKAVPDWRNRKSEAARIAGIPSDSPRLAAVLNLTDEGVAAMRVEWIRQFCPMEFAEFDTLIEFYYQTLTEIAKAKSAAAGKDLAAEYKSWMALATDLATLRSQIQALAEKLFNGDEDLRKLAMERSAPKAEAGSVEEAIFERRKGRK